ncbi:poly(glycerol-phosphate) alpha-glucosyltransferase [Paenibacillus forsythiae]|uniref:Poly(Glycerol-phosphate) alpha-glucosyltransferase n=1 Tax=Paenibacillus forsythiae TaxID=365616 RepID=A0ABU3HDH7_9BACL|nr:glycosyltransferase [Paenibacillus forsythiae]MDT3428873.1 poly(glycerol-phosphate) alpha-glucosyltransferase [Paenibacillus forsythiae]
MNYKVYITVNMLRASTGGLGKSVCTRVNMLIYEGRQVEILSTTFNKNVNVVRKELLDSGRLDKKAILRNMFEELGGDKLGAIDSEVSYVDSRKSIHHPINEKGFAVAKGDKENSYRLYKNGVYVKYKFYDKEERLQYIDYFNENRDRVKRETYDDKGYLNRIEYMDLKNNKTNSIGYFNQAGYCYLSTWINSSTGIVTKVNLFKDSDKHIKEFRNEEELKKYWIEQYVLKKDAKPIIISDIRNLDNLVMSLRNERLVKVAVMHNNHFEEPFHYGSPIKEHKMNLFNNVKKLDAVIFLTDQQKNDVQKQFGQLTDYKVISHSAPVIQTDNSKREDFTITSLSRYDGRKRLDHLIKAFKLVVEEVPQAKLELWGMGPEEEKLKRIVMDLNLSENVYLKGFTSNAIEVFERATASVLTSKHEGFGLVITESMAAGAPVISYDILYGPNDIINNGVNGFIIENNNIKELAKVIILFLKDADMKKKMSEEARKVSETFSFAEYTRKWLEFLEEISNK